MNRKALTLLLKQIAPVYPIGQSNKKVDQPPYLVLKRKNQQASLNNRLGGWLYYEVLSYTPASSILGSDEQLEAVTQLLGAQERLEVTGGIQGDYIDPQVNMYMQTVEFRIPKTIL